MTHDENGWVRVPTAPRILRACPSAGEVLEGNSLSLQLVNGLLQLLLDILDRLAFMVSSSRLTVAWF